MDLSKKRRDVATSLAKILKQRDLKIVFAESCTAGLIGATLGEVPGISNHFCGSAVTYRAATKIHWLDVDSAKIESFTTESSQVTEDMSKNVLFKTPESDVSAAVTGHLGPGAPSELDGVVFVAVSVRSNSTIRCISANSIKLKSDNRSERQEEAVIVVLDQVLDAVSNSLTDL